MGGVKAVGDAEKRWVRVHHGGRTTGQFTVVRTAKLFPPRVRGRLEIALLERR